MDRLKAVVTFDQSARPITEFVDTTPHLPRPMATWMDAYKGPTYRQMRITKDPTNNEAFARYWMGLHKQGLV